MPESPDAVRLQQIRERYARGDLLGIGPDIRWALDYADRLTAERDAARSVARSAAKLLCATADRIAVRTSESIDPNVLRRRARAVDEITGGDDV